MFINKLKTKHSYGLTGDLGPTSGCLLLVLKWYDGWNTYDSDMSMIAKAFWCVLEVLLNCKS